jgi:hypothetical protein
MLLMPCHSARSEESLLIDWRLSPVRACTPVLAPSGGARGASVGRSERSLTVPASLRESDIVFLRKAAHF